MTYTPLEWANALDFNPDDYVEITSYTHHPYYEPFRLEIPDNWTYDNYFNVPLEDLMHIIYHALQQGYSVCWDGDVSDKGFSHNHGVAIVPEDELTDMTGTEKTRWQELTEKEKQERLYSFDKPVKEKSITREMRQKAFMNHSATDDHLMHLTGIVQDQHGTWYYKTKNSWNDDSNDFGGYLNMSASFVKLNTIASWFTKRPYPNVSEKNWICRTANEKRDSFIKLPPAEMIQHVPCRIQQSIRITFSNLKKRKGILIKGKINRNPLVVISDMQKNPFKIMNPATFDLATRHVNVLTYSDVTSLYFPSARWWYFRLL